MAYLMTHSLLSAWLRSMQDNPFADATQEDTSKEDFLRVLRREPTPTTEAMQNGIDFEDLVTELVRGEQPNPAKAAWMEPAQKVAGIIRGGQLQYVATRKVVVDRTEFLLYGRLDALRAGRIYDIKFSKSYERGKYIDSTQHPMYLELLPSAESFTYLVSNGTELWTEKYRRDETRSIFPIIRDFVAYLDGTGLMPIYREHWVARK